MTRRHLRTDLPEKVKKFADVTVCDEPESQGSTALGQALGLITVKLSSLLELPASEVDSGEIYKLSNSLSGLVRASVELSRWQLEKSGAIGHAKQEFELLLRQHVEKHPKLVTKLQAIIASMDIAD
jgi:hypothetical protein